MIIGAYTNGDIEQIFNTDIEKYAEEIIDGLLVMGKELEDSELQIFAPNDAFALVIQPYADANNIAVAVVDFIHIRDYDAHFTDFATLIGKARISKNQSPVAFFQIDGVLKEIPFGKSIKEYMKEDELKAVLINHEYFQPDILEKEIDESWSVLSGKIQTIKENACIIQSLEEEILRLRNRSCGICTFCREGLYQMSTTIGGMSKPGMKADKVTLMQEIGEAMNISYMCSVGEHAAKPFLSAYALFKDEIVAHCGRGKCPTGKCKGFMNIYIDPHKCEGCGDCMDVCPKDCIDGKPKYISMIDEYDCDKCGKCIDVCDNQAIIVTANRVPKLPTRPTKVGRFK